MKRTALCVLLLLSLCGCGFLRGTSYVVVSPHAEQYGSAVSADVPTVNSYLGLKSALLNLVQDRVSDGVIRAESYSGNLAVELSQAVDEVSRLSPLGAYAVSAMTYDYSRIVSYYEIHVSTTFRRSLEEIQSVSYVADLEALEARLLEAMEGYESRLTLRLGAYEAFDPEASVEAVCLAHPEFALERPEASMELYPDSGSQRIVELKLSYVHTPEELLACRTELEERTEALASLYASNSQYTTARQLCRRLCRGGVLSQESRGSLAGGAYGALIGQSSDSYGYAQAYRLLLEAAGIPCRLVSGQLGGAARDWCRVTLDGLDAYVDPAALAGGRDFTYFLMGDAELRGAGYSLPQTEEEPVTELPFYLRPALPGG